MKPKIKLLFVCTGNACRSQMAEGWARELARGYVIPEFQVSSAGLEAHGVNPRAVIAMANCGVDISAHRSRVLESAMLEQADVVVTVCSHADSHCPVLPSTVRRITLAFPDPAAATGSDEEIAAVFASVCERIRIEIGLLLARLAVSVHQDLLRSGFDHGDVEILSRSKLQDGFIPVEELQLRHRLYRGGWSAPLRRELVSRPRAVGVLLYDPVHNQLVVLRQFRAGMVDESQSPWMVEIVAGLAASGEALIDVVKRETLEETSCTVNDILPICEYYNSPGWNNERVSLYCARVDATAAGGVHGLPEEHEDILVSTIAVDDAFAAVRSGLINNAMSIIAIQWLELNLETIRNKWIRAM